MKFEDDLNEEEIRAEWQRLLHAIEERKKRNGKPRRLRYAALAASLALLLLLGLRWILPPTYITHTTANGERQEVRLPDGSLVVLNSNSSIRYSKNWEGPRVVEMNGEAYFRVEKKADRREFLVRTPEGMEVSVLGTEFNVYERGTFQRVVLETGSVQLNYGGRDEPLMMKPGEMVTKDGPGAKPRKQEVSALQYSSWTRGLLIFENRPLREVCKVLEDQFGLEVRLDESLQQGRFFNGTFSLDDAGTIVKALETTYQLKARRQGNRIELTKK